MEQLDIGQLILQKLKEEERTAAWLARKMGRHRSYITRLLRKNDIHVNDLSEISKLLNCNFLGLYNNTTPKDLSAQ
jgi:IS30 family transposase